MRYAVYIFLLILVGCQNDNHFRIQGQMPDKSYDGEFIYLAPLDNPIKGRIDSAIVVNGLFTIEGAASSKEIFIIRARPLLRLTLQELLVVKEPGNLIVLIGQNSLVSGTALNDSLQRWKVRKLMGDRISSGLLMQYKSADAEGQKIIQQKADSLYRMNVDFTYNFVRNNRDNVVGKFVNKIMGDSFTPEQKKRLNLN